MISVLSSCLKEPAYTVDSELIPFFDAFKQEATARGVEIDVSFADLGGDITSINDPRVVGQCFHNTALPNEIKIDAEVWDNSSYLKREYIVFHELGHCYLDRNHLDTKDTKGNCLSMMESGGGACSDNYTESSRAKYITELFSQ